MKKQELIQLINDEKAIAFLATVDIDHPRVRPVTVRYSLEKLLLSTHTSSNKMIQLKGNPKVELAWLFPDMSHVRMEGVIEPVEDRFLKRKYMETHPDLKQFFKNEEDPGFSLLEVKPTKINFCQFLELRYSEVSW